MLNLQETTLQYMTEQFPPELLVLLVNCCTTLSNFGSTEFEHDLVALISTDDEFDADDIRDNFVFRIRTALSDVINEHMIKLDPGSEATLSELNELARFIYCLQNLEDTLPVEYRVYGLGSAKTVLIDLMATYSTMYKFRAMEIVSEVDDRLIKAIKAMVEDKAEPVVDNTKHVAAWKSFATFLGKDAPCLGLKLKLNGYFGLSLKELNELLIEPVSVQVENAVPTSLAQASLDLLSTLMLCSDTYEAPMDAISKQSSELFKSTTSLSQVKQCASVMYIDFNNWLQAQKPGLATQQGVTLS